ncbi:hypothetical protein [Cognatishimia sp.]|uniref:hypothetical protein n=1 Tax=Cognatishimia sp. TaxID=2211648 RepID=UPI003517AF5E|nr:hypothetical protein [Cognatishimia sp.]
MDWIDFKKVLDARKLCPELMAGLSHKEARVIIERAWDEYFDINEYTLHKAVLDYLEVDYFECLSSKEDYEMIKASYMHEDDDDRYIVKRAC